jgi:hypothetical protein
MAGRRSEHLCNSCGSFPDIWRLGLTLACLLSTEAGEPVQGLRNIYPLPHADPRSIGTHSIRWVSGGRAAQDVGVARMRTHEVR